MKTYSKEQLSDIIENHRKWLCDEDGGERADLSHANLRGADLSYAKLIDADLSHANLRGADLRGADLRDANLRGADLRDANLRDANLRGADLRGADLRDANLRDADLRDANLRDADLRDADLRGVSGNFREVKAIQADIWPATYTATHMFIGCQTHTLADWWAFSNDEISRMDSRALAWWKVWKPILKQIIEISPAVPGAQNKEA